MASRKTPPTDTAFDDIVKTTKNKPTISTKEADAESRRKEEVKAAMSTLSVDKALSSVSGSSLQVSKAFAQLSEDLIQQTQQLDTLREAIKIEQEELERLHGVGVVASTVDRLVAEYEAQKLTLEKTKADRQAQWAQEQADFNAKWDREVTDRKLARDREEAEYHYKTEQARREETDRWNDSLRQRTRAEQERTETLTKTWKMREEELAKAENELLTLRQQVTDFPAKLDAEVKKAEAILGRTMKKDYEAENALRASQWEGQAALLRQNILTLTDQIKTKDTEIVELRAQRAASEANVKEIATKAVDAASSKMSFAELSSLRSNDSVPTRKPS
jgi:hypothetical protein